MDRLVKVNGKLRGMPATHLVVIQDSVQIDLRT